jgi:predicted protein tyrosine phosphatase
MNTSTTVLSREAVRNIAPNIKEPFIWISIRDALQELISCTNPQCVGFIDLVFNDDSTSFTKVQAELIYEWLYTQDLDAEIIINCHAGISRSAAIASAIEETIFKNREHNYFKQKVPNMHVYKTMLEVYHNKFPHFDYLEYLIRRGN